MKTISLEIPDDANEERVREAAQRAADPEWIASWWHVDDVLSCDDDDSDLTREECIEVLRLTDHHFDAELGINWDNIQFHIEQVKDERTS